MRANSIAIIVLALCIVMLFSGCIDELLGMTYISYRASLLPFNGTAIVYIPIAINRDGSISDVMSNITICYSDSTPDAHVVYNITDTTHGKALKIVTSERFEVINQIIQKGIIDQNFSMWNGVLSSNGYYAVPVGSVWIYLDNSSTAEKVSLQHLEVDSSSRMLFGNAGLKIAINHPIENFTTLEYGWHVYPIYKVRY